MRRMLGLAVGLAALGACSAELDSKSRAMPICPDEVTFQELRAEFACRWARDCDLLELTHLDTCINGVSTPDPFDAVQWRECGATYNPCRAGECLAIWRENPVDCGVSFYSGCEWGDWYDGSEGCDVWGTE